MVTFQCFQLTKRVTIRFSQGQIRRLTTIGYTLEEMGTLKSVCSSWSGLISRDKYEHTHLRLWINGVFGVYFCAMHSNCHREIGDSHPVKKKGMFRNHIRCWISLLNIWLHTYIKNIGKHTIALWLSQIFRAKQSPPCHLHWFGSLVHKCVGAADLVFFCKIKVLMYIGKTEDYPLQGKMERARPF